MMLRTAPNLPTSSDAINELVRLLDAWDVKSFVDAGCGHGHVLLAAAQASPTRKCVGIDLDEDALSHIQAASQAIGLSNISLRHGDILSVQELVEAECVFSFTGAALHQSIAVQMMQSCKPAKFVTALYPPIGFPYTQVSTSSRYPLYLSFPYGFSRQIAWDAAVSVSVPFRHGVQLTSRAFKLHGSHRNVSASVRVLLGDAEWLDHVAIIVGVKDTVASQICGLDIIVAPDHLASAATLAISITSSNGILSPSHILVVGSTSDLPVESVCPWPTLDDPTGLTLAQADPALLIASILGLASSRPGS